LWIIPKYFKFFPKTTSHVKFFYDKLNIKLIKIAYCINNSFEMISDFLNTIYHILYTSISIVLWYNDFTIDTIYSWLTSMIIICINSYFRFFKMYYFKKYIYYKVQNLNQNIEYKIKSFEMNIKSNFFFLNRDTYLIRLSKLIFIINIKE
jgi:hypothetical protein